MKNIRTPRTLSESTFVTGYLSANVEGFADQWSSRLLAVAIGVGLALALVKWWS